MAGTKSILKIVQELETLCDDHDQIRSFKYGEFLDIIQTDVIEYSLAHLNIRQATRGEQSITYLLEFSVMDKTFKDISNINFVESTMLQVWSDIYNIIAYSPRWQDMGTVTSSSSPQKFRHKGSDEVTGWGATISFQIEDDAGFCDVPVTGYDYENTGTPLIGFGTYQNSDESFSVEINVNTTYTAPDITVTDVDLSTRTVPANTDVVCIPASCAVATYENSDASYTQTIASGATFVSADITVTDSDGSTFTQESNTDVVCTPGSTLSGILYQRPPLTGTVTSYSNYDDGWQLANSGYDYTKEDAETYARLDNLNTYPFHFLTELNSFGNYSRFTDENGDYYTNPNDNTTGTDVGAFSTNYIIDHLTGLGWSKVTQTSAVWSTALSNANSSTANSFSDWRMCNINELGSILWWSPSSLKVGTANAGLDYYPFSKGTNQEYYTSTTQKRDTTRAVSYYPAVSADISININRQPKTSGLPYFICRNHYT